MVVHVFFFLHYSSEVCLGLFLSEYVFEDMMLFLSSPNVKDDVRLNIAVGELLYFAF